MTSDDEAARDLLRSRLATLGVPLFVPTPATSDGEPTDGGTLLAECLRSDDPRLAAAAACPMTARPDSAGPAVTLLGPWPEK